ncbi:hypothetical protein GU700_12295 [Methylobacterium sp. NI91]|nr:MULTISPECIES: hypothetical protein [unclassified Methylobacterium]QIJ75303.1 hypothetical protein CLZ_12295 [Methylobacterium sp. CLZ]QIJ80208.1 hypothetical protein GU700_12295 [Methylobacterium sp. NI91]
MGDIAVGIVGLPADILAAARRNPLPAIRLARGRPRLVVRELAPQNPFEPDRLEIERRSCQQTSYGSDFGATAPALVHVSILLPPEQEDMHIMT